MAESKPTLFKKASMMALERLSSVSHLSSMVSKTQRRIFRFVDGGYYQAFSASLLFLSLFMSDSWCLGNAKDSQNDGLDGTLMFVFVVFALETVVFSVVQKSYFLSFFFWMDLLGTLSILLDISFVANNLLSGGSGGKTGILRATRAAKLGARYGRLMRILKLMRFIQYLPCFKQPDVDGAVEPTMGSIRKVTNQLNNALSTRVAFIVMTLVIVMPFLVYQQQTGQQVMLSWLTAIRMLAQQTSTRPCSQVNADVSNMIDKFQQFFHYKDSKLLSIVVELPNCPSPYSPIVRSFVTRANLRLDNITPYDKSFRVNKQGQRYTLTATTDDTTGHQEESLFGIIVILLVMLLLVGGASSFQSAVDRIVVIPLEKMNNTLRKSATVMLKSMKIVEDEKKKGAKDQGNGDDDDDLDGELETQQLEKMVEKLARLAGAMMPADVTFDTTNVDKDTSSWLTAQYSTIGRIFVQEDAQVSKAAMESKKSRILSLSSIESIVSPDVINSWKLDVLDYTNEQLIEVFAYIFGSLDIYEEFSLPEPIFKAFLLDIAHRYINTNTYHNFKHGCDVGHTVYRILMIPSLNLAFSHLEVFSLLVGAICHDVGHLGVNNVYLVKAKNDLALRFNDKSPLENMHCAVIYEVLKKEKCNIFVGLTESQWRDARKVILTAVLGTDMSHHFEQISKTQVFLEVNGDDIHKFCSGEKNTIDCLSQEKDRLFVLEVCLHCADISNPYKPWNICERWAHLVIEEFACQGDRERSEGLEISPMCDRATINLCNSQLGFIEFVVAPLIIGTLVFRVSLSLSSLSSLSLIPFLSLSLSPLPPQPL